MLGGGKYRQIFMVWNPRDFNLYLKAQSKDWKQISKERYFTIDRLHSFLLHIMDFKKEWLNNKEIPILQMFTFIHLQILHYALFLNWQPMHNIISVNLGYLSVNYNRLDFFLMKKKIKLCTSQIECNKNNITHFKVRQPHSNQLQLFDWSGLSKTGGGQREGQWRNGGGWTFLCGSKLFLLNK